MVKKEDIEQKATEVDNLHKQKKAKKIIREFLKNNGDSIIETTKKYTKENGPGALFITLVPKSDELDIEYFKMDDLDGNFKKKLQDNPNLDKTVYYAIRLYKTCYTFERRLD